MQLKPKLSFVPKDGVTVDGEFIPRTNDGPRRGQDCYIAFIQAPPPAPPLSPHQPHPLPNTNKTRKAKKGASTLHETKFKYSQSPNTRPYPPQSV